jgi:tRNA-modifying protein YgfZ
LRTTPLIEFFESLGFTYDSTNGRKVIKNYSSTEEELNSLYNGVGLRDISHYGILELKGTDVLDFLHRISTNSLKNLPKEHIARTILTTEKGRIIDIPLIMNFESQQLCICSSYFKQKVTGWLNKYVIADDVSVVDTGDKYVLLELLGPQADSFAVIAGGTTVNNLEVNRFKVIHSDGMLFFLVKFKDKNNRSRYWFISDHDNAKLIVNYLLKNRGLFDFNLIGDEAYKIYRIEQGLPAVPGEISDEYNPHEAGLMDLVDTKKGCYIGHEVIARLDTYDKVQRTLMGIKFPDEQMPSSSDLVDEAGAEAGKITSVVYSPRCKSVIGLAYLRRAFAEEGRQLLVKGSSAQAEVSNLPFRK